MSSHIPVITREWQRLRATPEYKAARSRAEAKARTAKIEASRQRAMRLRMSKMPSEYKHVDVNSNGVLNATQYFGICINSVSAGTGFFNRVGNRINPVWANFDVSVANNAAVPIRCRIIAVWDTQPTEVVPTLDLVLQDVNGEGTGATQVASGRNTNNSMRFKTLMDKLLFLSASGVSGNAQLVREIRFLRDYSQSFKSTHTPPTIADIASGALLLYCYADTTAEATINYQFNTRFKYQDP